MPYAQPLKEKLSVLGEATICANSGISEWQICINQITNAVIASGTGSETYFVLSYTSLTLGSIALTVDELKGYSASIQTSLGITIPLLFVFVLVSHHRSAADAGIRIIFVGRFGDWPNGAPVCPTTQRCWVGLRGDYSVPGPSGASARFGVRTCAALPSGKRSQVWLYNVRVAGVALTDFTNELHAQCPEKVDFPVLTINWTDPVFLASWTPVRDRTVPLYGYYNWPLTENLLLNMFAEHPRIAAIVCYAGGSYQQIWIANWLKARYGNFSTKTRFVLASGGGSMYQYDPPIASGGTETGLMAADLLQTGDLRIAADETRHSPDSQLAVAAAGVITGWAQGISPRIDDIDYIREIFTSDPAAATLKRIMDGYHKANAPFGVSVSVGFEIASLGSLDTKDGSIGFLGWLHSQWVDPRLSFDSKDLLWVSSVDVDPTQIWDPLLSFVGLLPADLDVLSTLSGGTKMKIYPHGKVQKAVYVSLRVKCKMTLKVMSISTCASTLTDAFNRNSLLTHKNALSLLSPHSESLLMSIQVCRTYISISNLKLSCAVMSSLQIWSHPCPRSN